MTSKVLYFGTIDNGTLVEHLGHGCDRVGGAQDGLYRLTDGIEAHPPPATNIIDWRSLAVIFIGSAKRTKVCPMASTLVIQAKMLG